MKKIMSCLLLSSFLLGVGITNVDASDFNDFLSEKNHNNDVVEVDYNKKEFTYEELSENVDILFVDQPETYAKIALDFAKGFSPNKEFKVSEMIPIYDTEGVLVAYDCKIMENENDHGYVIVDNRLKGDFIAEFNLDFGVSSLFSNMISSSDIDKETDEVKETEKAIIETDMNTYSVSVDDTVVTSDGMVQDTDEFIEELKEIPKSSPYSHSGDVLEDYPSSYSFVDWYAIGQFYFLKQEAPEKAVSKFACSVSAMTIIADKIGITPGSAWNEDVLKKTYNQLWKDSGTFKVNSAKKFGKTITYGSTYDNKLIGAMNSLAKSNNKKVNSSQIQSPSFSQMESSIKKNRPFVYGYSVTNGKSGHSVAAQGIFKGKKGNSTHNFLIVANGWTEEARYLNISSNQKYLSGTCMTSFW